ncbi:MAG: 4Fe-4S cluster-binding domain-containing protein [Bacteroidales bacterium]|nr:4Fe-4S cluster-binding domain-containing protein [Bacteroidales bacterium]
MKLRGIVDEDICNYQKISMFLIFPYCSFKCDKESGKKICQNSSLVKTPILDIDINELCDRYVNNPVTNAIVCGGLEPFDSKFELFTFIDTLRRVYKCNDDIVIYTGYTKEELETVTEDGLSTLYKNLFNFPNIIVKYGRYIPNEKPHYDEFLGVELSSNNQYARRLTNENIDHI